MLGDLLIGGAISFLNFGIHAMMTAVIVVATRFADGTTRARGIFMRLTTLLTIAVAVLMCAHVAEIAVWAWFLDLAGIHIKGTRTFEFAFENYTALGYGDALPVDSGRRLIGPIMALNGLLLIGWSVAVIFEVMRMAEFRLGNSRSD
jgi:Ion channel